MPPAGGGEGGCPASVTARGSGTSEPDRRWRKDTEERTPTAIYEWRGQVQCAPPPSAALLRGHLRQKGTEPAVLPRRASSVGRRSASSPPAGPIPPSAHPAAVPGSSGGGGGKRRGSGRVSQPALPPAGRRALGYPCALTATLCGHRVTQTSRRTLTVPPLSLQGVRNPQGSIGAIWFIDFF